MTITNDHIRKGTRAALIVYWLALFFATHIPTRSVEVGVSHFDKYVHFIAFFLLAFLFCVHVTSIGRLTLRKSAGVFIVVGVYAAVDELLQLEAFGRTTDAFDFGADCAGAIVGIATYELISRFLVRPQRGTTSIRD